MRAQSPLDSPALGAGDIIERCGDDLRPDAPTPAPDLTVGAAFSGGGFRATLAALGVMRCLADVGLLASLRYASSVSGGSIANGLLGRRWPALRAAGFTGAAVNELLIGPVVERLSDRSLKWSLISQVWRTVGPTTRTDVLADEFDGWFFDDQHLEALIPRWTRECARAGLIPGARPRRPAPEGLERLGRVHIYALDRAPFDPDRAAPNGTSIAVLADYGGRRVLFAADAHPERLAASLRPLAAADGGRVALDAFKLPHHGSEHNVSHELIDLVACPRFLNSTNGAYNHHPSPVAVARVIKRGKAPELVFNCRSPEAIMWAVASWQRRHGYRTTCPAPADDGTIAVASP